MNLTLNAGTLGLISKRNRLKFPTLHSPFCLFIIKDTLTEYFEICSFWRNHQMYFKMVHFDIKTQNLELDNLKCVTYAQPIPLSLT